MSKHRRKNYKTWGYFFNKYKGDPSSHFEFFAELCRKAIKSSNIERPSCYLEFRKTVKQAIELEVMCFPTNHATYGLLETGRIIYGTYNSKAWDGHEAIKLTKQLSDFLKKRYV